VTLSSKYIKLVTNRYKKQGMVCKIRVAFKGIVQKE